VAARSIRILHTNDLHGSLDERRFSALSQVRSDFDLYFDTGDCIKAGNLGVPLKPEPVWTRLADLRCTASVPGNRESHLLKAAFEAKLAGHRHPILCANLFDRDGHRPLPPSLVVSVDGFRVGLVGTMVAMVTERMSSKALSNYLWTAPIPAAIEEANRLRPDVDGLIALTHIGFKQDQALAQATDLFDLILGGHSHTLLEHPTQIGRTWICQAGSHGRYYGSYRWEPEKGLVTGGPLSL